MATLGTAFYRPSPAGNNFPFLFIGNNPKFPRLETRIMKVEQEFEK